MKDDFVSFCVVLETKISICNTGIERMVEVISEGDLILIAKNYVAQSISEQNLCKQTETL